MRPPACQSSAILLQDTRPAQDGDGGCAGRQEGAGRGIRRGAGRVHVVHQPQVAAGHPPACRWRNRKGAAYRTSACGRTGVSHRRGAARTHQDLRIVRASRTSGHIGRDQCRLVEAARPEPAAVQRHGDQQIHFRRHQPRQVACHDPRQSDPPAIFEPERQCAGGRTIGHRRPHAGMARRVGKAGGTARARTGIEGQWPVAAIAPGRRQEPNRTPARRAKASVLRHHRAATGTARREHQVGHETEGTKNRPHAAACRRPS